MPASRTCQRCQSCMLHGQVNFVHVDLQYNVNCSCWPTQYCSSWPLIAGQHNLVHVGQHNVFRVSCCPAQHCSCWPTPRSVQAGQHNVRYLTLFKPGNHTVRFTCVNDDCTLHVQKVGNLRQTQNQALCHVVFSGLWLDIIERSTNAWANLVSRSFPTRIRETGSWLRACSYKDKYQHGLIREEIHLTSLQ